MSNWWLDQFPDSSRIVLINSTDECPVVIDYGCAAESNDIVLAQSSGTAELVIEPGVTLDAVGDVTLAFYSGLGIMHINGGTVDIAGVFSIGYGIGAEGIVNIASGRVNVAGTIDLGDQGGHGYLNMTGGKVVSSDELTMLNGGIKLYGGLVQVSDLFFIPPYSTFDIANNGTLVITKDLSGYIGHSVDSVTACGGNGTTIKQFIGGYTILTTDCECPAADTNMDCKVDLYDLAELANEWLTNVN